MSERQPRKRTKPDPNTLRMRALLVLARREKLGLSPKELEAASGVKLRTIHRLEEEFDVRRDSLLKLASALNVRPDIILYPEAEAEETAIYKINPNNDLERIVTEAHLAEKVQQLDKVLFHLHEAARLAASAFSLGSKPGSLRVALSVTRSDAFKIFGAFKNNALSDLGVIDFDLSPTPLPRYRGSNEPDSDVEEDLRFGETTDMVNKCLWLDPRLIVDFAVLKFVMRQWYFDKLTLIDARRALRILLVGKISDPHTAWHIAFVTRGLPDSEVPELSSDGDEPHVHRV